MVLPERIVKLDKKDNRTVEIVVVLDKSGSMGTIQDATIESYNKFLREQKAEPGAANITLVQFSDNVTVGTTMPLAEALPLTKETFSPDGMTALNDGIGTAIQLLERKNTKYAVITILTDGGENHSKEFNSAQIKTMISRCQDKLGWRVIYLGANQDSFAVGNKMYGVKQAFTANWTASAAGMAGATQTASLQNSGYRSLVDKGTI